MSDNNESRILHLTHLLWALEKRVKIVEEKLDAADDRDEYDILSRNQAHQDATSRKEAGQGMSEEKMICIHCQVPLDTIKEGILYRMMGAFVIGPDPEKCPKSPTGNHEWQEAGQRPY